MSFILPPKTVAALDASQKLGVFFAKERKACRDNPHCKCAHQSFCANREITTPTDWRAESLDVGEQVALEYKALAKSERGTIPIPRAPKLPTFSDK